MAIKETVKKVTHKIKANSERSARKKVIEELFYDFNRDRARIYKINLFRGIFFGFGSVLGGTLIVALLIWVLSALAGIFPPLSDLFEGIRGVVKT